MYYVSFYNIYKESSSIQIMNDIKIIHLIHADGPGGVETGAKLAQQEFKKILFNKFITGYFVLVKIKKKLFFKIL